MTWISTLTGGTARTDLKMGHKFIIELDFEPDEPIDVGVLIDRLESALEHSAARETLSFALNGTVELRLVPIVGDVPGFEADYRQAIKDGEPIQIDGRFLEENEHPWLDDRSRGG